MCAIVEIQKIRLMKITSIKCIKTSACENIANNSIEKLSISLIVTTLISFYSKDLQTTNNFV